MIRLPAAPNRMNDNEAAFAAQQLEPLRLALKRVVMWRYEQITFRLADNTTYTPDFEVVMSDGLLVYVETKILWKVKGRRVPTMRAGRIVMDHPTRVGWPEDSRVKIKCTAEQFSDRVFLAAWRNEAGVWTYEPFPPHADKGGLLLCQ